jgi:AcrR family transcriptional regulator
MEDTKQRILEKSLELFSTKGYDAVSVGEIAKAVGIKAPSLYNHFPSKQAIFDAILETTSAHYQKDTAEISVHVQDSQKDIPVFSHISEELLVEKVRQIFLYSLHDKTISQFRRMMTLEQFRSPKFAELLSKRYAGIFRALVANGELRNEDPDTLAWMYVSPIIVLLSVCDRQPEREAESLAKLDAHVKLFFRTFNIVGGEK